MAGKVYIKASFTTRTIRVQDRSLLARVAATILRSEAAAIVFGHTIYVWGRTGVRFALHTPWLHHELMHVQQYCRLGFTRFLATYLWLWLKHGYRRHPLELEAVGAELNPPFTYELFMPPDL